MIKGWIVTVEIRCYEYQFKFVTIEDATDFIRVFLRTYIGEKDDDNLERTRKAKCYITPILEEPADGVEDDIPVQ